MPVTMALALSLLSITASTWASPLPPEHVGIQGVINHACQDVYEVDDTATNAGTLAIETPQVHNFDSNSLTGIADKDWVKFQLAPGKVYTLTTSNLSSQTDTAIALYADPASTAVTSNDDGGGALGKGSQIVWTVPNTASGAYYLAVTNSTGNSSTAYEDCAGTEVRYTLTLQGPTITYLYLPFISR
jgi:hypothetical protein